MTAVVAEKDVPPAAGWLGGLGVVPFIAFAALAVLAPSPWAALAVQALGLYGAVILSFLGGIQWGLAIGGPQVSGGTDVSFPRLTVSIMPALMGWCALMLPWAYGFILLVCAFALVLVVDLRATRENRAPAWYPRLRWPLTLTAIAALIVGALA